MGRNKLIMGVVIGAAVGGAAALADRDTRKYVKLKMDDAKTGTSFIVENPTEAVQSLRNGFNTFNQTLAQGTDSAINALDQVEKTLERVTASRNKNELTEYNDNQELQLKQ